MIISPHSPHRLSARAFWRRAALLTALLMPVALSGEALAQSGADPEAGGPRRAVAALTATRAMAVTANEHATRAALEMLRGGGNAVDAAVTAQWVLNVVEPQSSGLGGGGFLLLHVAGTDAVVALDGRETAPAEATPGLFLGPDGASVPFFPQRITGGRAVGTPGLLHLLALALERYGTRTLAETLQPAIRLAEEGIPVSPRLAESLRGHAERLAQFPATRAVFFDAQGRPLEAGTHLRQPALARTFHTLAAQGPEAFYRGPIGAALVAAVRGSPVAPGLLSGEDLARYRSRAREPVRAEYRGYTLYGMGPPSSGATTVFQMLGLLETQPVPADPFSPQAVHRFAQAARLAFADRGRYLGDPDFVPVPVAGLLDPGYVARRAAALDWAAPLAPSTPVAPGEPPGASAATWGAAGTEPATRSTTHLSVVDAQGNAVALTSSIEQAFGSGIVVPGWGFLLNNQLTDFDAVPTDEAGRPRANALAPGKRPRSSMAPTLVLREGRPVLVLGSPGGARIIQYVAEVLLRVLDHGMPLQEAIAAPHHTHLGGRTTLEPPLVDTPLPAALAALGHRVEIATQGSGLHGIAVQPTPDATGGRLHAGVDPRREGTAAGY